MVQEKERRFIDELVARDALKFDNYKLKSGRIAPFYLNLGNLSSGSDLDMLAKAYSATIREKFCDNIGNPQFDVLFGPAYKGIALAAAVVMHLWNDYRISVRYCANRKETKDHGDAGDLVGGPIKPGDRVVIIEDVTTSGKSIGEVMPILEAHHAKIVGEIISLDRCERADDSVEYALDAIKRKYGFPVYAITDMHAVIEHLYTSRNIKDRTIITEAIYQDLLKYYEEYGGKKIVSEESDQGKTSIKP